MQFVPDLSICIPTYNRRDDLDRLLCSLQQSLASLQRSDCIEIVISDNASEDGTATLVAAWQARMPNITYVRNAHNVGYAGNMNQVVGLAEAPYCWLMGSDEQVLPQGLQAILAALQDGADVILGSPVTHGRQRHYLPHAADVVIAGPADYASYLSSCQEFSAAFAFISTIVVRKDFWATAQCSDWELAHPYTHMLRICRQLAKHGGRVNYLDKAVVLTGWNVNEWNKTILPHFELDLKTIEYICGELFNHYPAVFDAYGRVFRRQYNWVHVFKSRVESKRERWDKMIPSLMAFGYYNNLLRKRLYDPQFFVGYCFFKWLRGCVK